MMEIIAGVCGRIAHEANRRYTDIQSEYLDRQSIELAKLKEDQKRREKAMMLEIEQKSKAMMLEIARIYWRSKTVNPQVFVGKRKRGRGRPSKPKLILLKAA